MDSIAKQSAALSDEIAQILAMNPSLSLDELNAVMHDRVEQRNTEPDAAFYGLSPTQMQNWLYAPLNELTDVMIKTPTDLSRSPVMRYLELILNEAMQHAGSFKATAKGNLPAKLVKQASNLLPEFAVSQYSIHISINDFAGSNEDKFDALHYTRVLAEIAGIIYIKSGRVHVKKAAQKQYKAQGINAFFMPMLDTALTKYNWGYFDGWDDNANLSIFWLFMVWRLHSHRDLDKLTAEVATAFPAFVQQLTATEYCSQTKLLDSLIEARFIDRFLKFWGFVTVNPRLFFKDERLPRIAELQPLLSQTFQFMV